MIMLADGFGATWTNYLTGADRVGLDHHFCPLSLRLRFTFSPS
jgi:hypothetical protein